LLDKVRLGWVRVGIGIRSGWGSWSRSESFLGGGQGFGLELGSVSAWGLASGSGSGLNLVWLCYVKASAGSFAWGHW